MRKPDNPEAEARRAEHESVKQANDEIEGPLVLIRQVGKYLPGEKIGKSHPLWKHAKQLFFSNGAVKVESASKPESNS